VLELLFQELQADIHIKDWKNRFPIHHAAATGGTEKVLFLRQNRSCLNSKTRVIRDRAFDELGNNQGGMTPVHYAAQNGYGNSPFHSSQRHLGIATAQTPHRG